MGEEADVKGGQPWRFDIRIVALDDLPQDVDGVAVLWAKGEVRLPFFFKSRLKFLTLVQIRKSTPVCAACAGRAVFEPPPVLGLETMLKMNEGNIFFFQLLPVGFHSQFYRNEHI